MPAGLTIDGETLIASNDYEDTVIDLAKYDANNVDASALKTAIRISGNDSANILVGGKGADTIFGNGGNDTLTGGTGKDIFLYSKGKVVITDYKEKMDKIALTSGKVTNTLQSGLDMIFKIGTTNAITVGGGMNQAITIVGSDGEEVEYRAEATLPDGLTYTSSTKKLTVAANYGGAEIGIATLPAGATATKTVDATKYAKALKITAASTAITINGGSKANTLTGGKANDKITGGKGNDVLSGEAGNDTIYSGGGNDTLTGGDGKDVFIYEGGKSIITDYTAGQDTLKISSGSVTGATLKSSDMLFTISGSSNNLTVKGGKDTEIAIGNAIYFNNVIYDSKKTTASLGSNFSGTLKASDYYSKTKTVNASNVTKAVYLNGNDAANSILGGKGNDTLAGGKGNDTLTGGAGKDVFIYSAGNDLITDYVSGTDTIKITGAVSSASLKSSDMTFKIGNNTLTVKNGKDKEIAIGNAIYFNNVIYDSKKTTASLGSNFSGTLKASDYYSKTKTVNASNVSKAVYLNGNDAANSILGGKGNDTLAGGKGNDTLTGGDGKDVFLYTGGNDLITDYVAGTDTIKITGAVSSASLKSSDMTFKIGSNTLTVKNGKDKDIAIDNSIYHNNLIYDSKKTGVTLGRNYMPYDVIKTLMQSLDATELAGTEALDEAVRASSKGKFGSAEEVINKILEDCEKTGDADTFLREYCGIVLENEDTGAISGWDMGSGVVKDAESIVQENSVRDSNFTDNSFTVQGLTFKLGKWINSDDTTDITFDDLNDDQKFVWQSLYSYWADAALTLINQSYNFSFTDTDATVKEITVTFVRNSHSGELASTYYVDLDPPDGKIDQLVLTINTAHYANFSADDVNGISSSGQEYLDRTIAHELTHAIMNAKIAYRYDLPMIITEGTAEITQGIDDVRKSELLKLAGDIDLLKKVLRLDTDYNTVEGITAPDYSGGYIFLRYLAWQSVDLDQLGISVDNRTGNKLVAGSRFADTITNIAANATVASYEFADTITNSGSNVLIDAGADADFISNSGKSATIIAGKGNDTITNTQAGAYFRYDSGDGFDLITGASASDTLFIGTGDYSVSTNNTDKIISLDNGAITLANAADIDITILDPKRFVSLTGGAYYNDYDRATIFGSSVVDSINNTASFVTISALGGDDYIGSGGDFSSLSGGNGNDYIYNAGSNVTIDTGSGNNIVVNNGEISGVTILGGNDGDSIVNFSSDASKILINAGSGDDTVYNVSNEVTINGGGGNDSVRSTGNDLLILTTDGNDSINNTGANLTLDAGNGDNWIYTEGNATITTGGGKDTVQNHAANSQIQTGAGDDSIRNVTLAANSTIDAGAGNNIIYNFAGTVNITAGDDTDYISNNSADFVTIAAGGGNNTIQNITGNHVTIEAGAGADTIYSNSDSGVVAITAGDGDNSINNWSADTTIIAGAGADTVVNSGVNVTIDAGAGADTVYNSAESVYANLGAGDDTFRSLADNVTVEAGAGADYLYNFSSNVSIDAGSGADYIFNQTLTSAVTIIAGAGDDTVYNSAVSSLIELGGDNDSIMNLGSSVTIDGGDGADFIYTHTVNGGSDNTSISGGAGADTIYALSDSNKVDGGEDSDLLIIGGKNSTVNGGAGNNAIQLLTNSDKTYIHYGGGSDTVYGIGANDTVEVESGYSSRAVNGHLVINENLYVVNGANVNFTIVTIPATDITLTEAADNYLNNRSGVKIYALGGNDTIDNTADNVTISGGAGADSIRSKGNNVSIDAGSGDNFISNDGIYSTIIVGDGADTIMNFGEGVLIQGSGDNVIQNSATSVTIATGAGVDKITNYRGRAFIDAGDGDNHIDNGSNGAESTIIAGAGNDSVTSNADKVFISLNGGENHTDNTGSFATITTANNYDSDFEFDAVFFFC